MLSITRPGSTSSSGTACLRGRATKEIIFFVQQAEKFDARYATLGFNGGAKLDDGDMWPTSFAVQRITPAIEKRITELLQRAVD